MANRDILKDWVLEALEDLGGEATVLQVCEWVWSHHEADLVAMGNLFYSWQYDIRWAALKLRKEGRLGPTDRARNGIWTLA